MPDTRTPIYWSYDVFGMDTRIPPVSPRVLGFPDTLNGYFTSRASYRSRPGHSYLGGIVHAGAVIDGAIDFWIDNVTQFTIVAAFGSLYRLVSGVWTALTMPANVISTPGLPVNFAVLDNLLVFGNGTDHNGYYDGTTVFDLNSQLTPCKYFTQHGHRMFASGDPSNPSTLYWCGIDDPTDWTSAGNAGSDTVEKGAEVIIGTSSFFSDLYIMKGDKYPAIDVLDGSTYDDFTMRPLFHDISGYHRSLLPIGNDLLIGGNSGIYSLSLLISNSGDAQRSRISAPVQSIFDGLNKGMLPKQCAVWNQDQNIAVFYLSQGGTALDTALCVQPPADLSGGYRWSRWNVPPMTVAAQFFDPSIEQTMVMIGLQDGASNGRITEWEVGSDKDADGTSFPSYIRTSFLSNGNQRTVKGARHMTMTYLSAGQLNCVLYFLNGTNYVKPLPTTATGVWGTGTWGSGTWGSAAANSVNVPLRGYSEAIQVSIEKVSGAYELFDQQFDVVGGGRSER